MSDTNGILTDMKKTQQLSLPVRRILVILLDLSLVILATLYSLAPVVRGWMQQNVFYLVVCCLIIAALCWTSLGRSAKQADGITRQKLRWDDAYYPFYIGCGIAIILSLIIVYGVCKFYIAPLSLIQFVNLYMNYTSLGSLILIIASLPAAANAWTKEN